MFFDIETIPISARVKVSAIHLFPHYGVGPFRGYYIWGKIINPLFMNNRCPLINEISFFKSSRIIVINPIETQENESKTAEI